MYHHAPGIDSRSKRNVRMMATMIPKMPSADAKISTIKILTKSEPSCASASAQLLPAMPTATPEAMLLIPTESPEEKVA